MIFCKAVNSIFWINCIFCYISENEIMSKLLQRILSLTRQNGVRRHVVHVASVTGNGTAGAGGSNRRSHVDAFDLMKPQLSGLMEDIHTELDSELVVSSKMGDLAK